MTVLQCVSSYPAEPKEMHLANIQDIAKRFKVKAGLSDHTLSHDVAVASVALGARVLEKHLTLRRSDGGPDSSFSLEPAEFRTMVASIRTVEKAIGIPSYKRSKGENVNVKFRKSLFVVKDMKKGECFTSENVRSIRPGNGMAPKFCRSVLGKHATMDIKRATPLRKNLIQ